jgi:hypothetical protein
MAKIATRKENIPNPHDACSSRCCMALYEAVRLDRYPETTERMMDQCNMLHLDKS